jgi:serine phosphatase RsbU (regulator of sigma subunit)
MTLLGDLSTLETAGLVRVAQIDPDLEYLFRHALVQDAAYTSILESDRRRLHLAVGEAVERLYPERLEELSAMLARHFENADDSQRALKYFVMAGEAALTSYANQEAEIQFRCALELTCSEAERAQLLSCLGEALYGQSRFSDAIQVWRQGIDHYRSLEDSDGAARLYARSARAAWHWGDQPLGLRLCEEGMDVLRGAPESHGMALLMHETGRAYYFNGIVDKALPMCKQALKLAEKLEVVDVQADTLATLGVIPGLEPEEAIEALEKSVALSESAGLNAIAHRAHHNLGTVKSGLLGDQLAAREHYLRASEISRQRGMVSEELFSLMSAAGVSLGLGELSTAAEYIATMEGLAREVADPEPAEMMVRSIKANLLWMQGESEDGLVMFRQCRDETRERGDLQTLAGMVENLASALLEMDRWGEKIDWDEVDAAVQEAIDIGERGIGGLVWPNCMVGIIRARQGRLQEAHESIAKAQEASLQTPSVWNEMALAAAGTELAVAEDRLADAQASSEKIVRFFAKRNLRWNWARTLQDWAEIHVLQGELTDLERAQALLREALSMFEEMGARRHAQLVLERLNQLRAESYKLAVETQKATQELARARRVQEGLLPDHTPQLPGWQVAASLNPARETSGDFYDFIPLSGGKWGIVVADVADKGAGAALFMALSRSLIRTYAAEYESKPEIVLGETNWRMLADTQGGMFVTVFYGVLDPETGTLVYSNAGHNPPYLFRLQDPERDQELIRTGVPLGIMEDAIWEHSVVQIESGDLLILYTDGVTEAMNSQDKLFGVDRLLSSVRQDGDRPVEEIRSGVFTDIQDFVAGVPQYDDITLMVIKRD